MTARLIARTGELRGTTAAVSDVLTIGSGPGNGIRIASRTVSRRHAQIVKSGTEYFVEDLGSRNGTFLNGQRVKRFPVRHLDVLSIGPDTDLIFMQSGAPVPAVTAPASLRGTICWLDGPLEGKVQEFSAGRSLILGRSVDLPVEAISLRHAALTVSDDGATAEDLRSTNGTFVNGKLISHATILSDGDEVSLGNIVRFRVSLLRGVSQETLNFVGGAGPVTMVVDRKSADQKTLVVPSPAPQVPAQAAADLVPERADEPPSRIPEREPAPPPSIEAAPAGAAAPPSAPPAAASEAPHPGDGTIAAPRAPAVAPAFNAPASAPEVKTVKPPREAAGGLPGNIAARARAAREAVDATFAVPPSAKPQAAPPSEEAPTPEVVPGPHNLIGVRLDGPQDITLNRGTFVVGRHIDCDIHLDLRDVGRRHARLTVGEDVVTVEDLGSANGTFVNGAPVSGPRVVPDGGTVRFAAIEFTVSYLRSEG